MSATEPEKTKEKFTVVRLDPDSAITVFLTVSIISCSVALVVIAGFVMRDELKQIRIQMTRAADAATSVSLQLQEEMITQSTVAPSSTASQSTTTTINTIKVVPFIEMDPKSLPAPPSMLVASAALIASAMPKPKPTPASAEEFTTIAKAEKSTKYSKSSSRKRSRRR